VERRDIESGGFTARIFQEMLGVRSPPPWRNQKFESTSLQRRVWCELSRSNFLDLDQDADSPLRSIQLASIARMWQAGTGQRPQKVDAG
jgi:hypothetical protein